MSSVGLNQVVEENVEKIELIGFGDWHIGAKACDLEKIKQDIEWIRENKHARVILMGDMMDCGTKNSVGAGTFDNNMIPQEQFETVLNLLEPIKDKIYGIHMGNHEQRIMNETGVNITKMIAKSLGIRYLGYSAFSDIRINDIHYIIYSNHGSSGAKLPHTKIKRCLDMSNYADADIYMMGHVHALQSLSHNFKRVNLKNKKIDEEKKHFVLTGHYLNYEDSYGEMQQLIPSEKGFAKIRLDGYEKAVFVSL